MNFMKGFEFTMGKFVGDMVLGLIGLVFALLLFVAYALFGKGR